MLMTESSVEDLNSRLDGKVAAMAQFRPNFVAAGCSSLEEDEWDKLYIGSAVFTNIKPCDRLVFPREILVIIQYKYFA